MELARPARTAGARAVARDCTGVATDFEVQLLAVYPALIRRLTLVLRDPAAAEDVGQAAFVRALERRAQFKGGDTRAWFYTIGLRLAFNELRRRRPAGLSSAGEPTWAMASEPDLWLALGQLEAALAQAWAGEDCMSAGEATVAARAALDRLGKVDWQVAVPPAVGAGTGCTVALVLATTHEVRLIGGAGGALAHALGAFKMATFEQCFTRLEARAALASVLAAFGVADYDIHDGPVLLYGEGAVPRGRAEAYREHARHCYLYGGQGWDADAKPWYRLWGPWP